MGRRDRRDPKVPDLADLPPRGLDTVRLDVATQPLFVLSFPIPGVALPASLTPAEREVALHILEGASNREIADARGVSVRTVANQVRSLFDKLEVNTRAKLVARLLAHARGRHEDR